MNPMDHEALYPPERHLDAAAVYALLDGRLSEPGEQAAEAHLWRCDRCRSLREECAAVLSSLRWYGADPPAPPEGYWDEFWTGFGPKLRPPARRLFPALALAASIALLLLIQPGPESAPDDRAPIVSAPAPGPEWASEYRLFEQATVAIGSVDPVSKGIVLAGLAEPR
ncbi:MAG TPA: zf-HC2 domain-containing protein [Gemmatimonadota bacterium]|nr:zf-HC2 domain-containing protein [Gemmatimonadota bacterium]